MRRREFIMLLGRAAQVQPVPLLLVVFSAILLTSVVLLAVDSFVDAEALAFIYLLPTVVMAMHYGSTVGVLTSFAGALAAAYFCFPPKFSFYISDPLNVAESGFFLLLAVIASKAVAVVTRDDRVIKSTSITLSPPLRAGRIAGKNPISEFVIGRRALDQ